MRNIKRNGFTLIELMIVIAIIGVLASIALPQFSNFSSRTRAAGAVSEMNAFRSGFAVCMSEQSNVLAKCITLGSNGIPYSPASLTSNIKSAVTITPATGAINVTSGSTDETGTSLTFVLTPIAIAAGDAKMIFRQDGTICNPTRGLKPGHGDCP